MKERLAALGGVLLVGRSSTSLRTQWPRTLPRFTNQRSVREPWLWSVTATTARLNIRDGLAPAFLRENIPVTFIENVDARNADSLQDFQLLVIFRDGMNWPNGHEKNTGEVDERAQQQGCLGFRP